MTFSNSTKLKPSKPYPEYPLFAHVNGHHRNETGAVPAGRRLQGLPRRPVQERCLADAAPEGEDGGCVE